LAKYTHSERIEILRVCLDLANETITLSAAEDKIRAISKVYPLHTIPTEKSRLVKYLLGKPTYGYGYAVTWAEALLELTNKDKLVISALKAQQKVYLEKNGSENQKLKKLLADI